jgi:hypothetical protein
MIAALYEAVSEHGIQTYNYKMFTFGICLHEIERNLLIFESVQCGIICYMWVVTTVMSMNYAKFQI